MKKVLLAGASGHLGRHLLAELKGRGIAVRCISRRPERLQGAGADEVVVGDLTSPLSLQGVCSSVDAVISCAGASMNVGNILDRAGFTEVDYRGNLNLLEEARRGGVGKFVYVSLFAGERLRSLEYALAHERFVDALRTSGIDYTIVRPNGFYSFNAEIFRMAAKGWGMVIGSGESRTNPVHDRDVAIACVDALEGGSNGELAVGGPDIYTRREVVELAFEVLGRGPRIVSIPPGLFRGMIAPLALLNPRMHALMAFGAAVSVTDIVAPARGRRELRSYFEALHRGGEAL